LDVEPTLIRYLKTTLYGMSGQMPDYSFLVISAETGVGGYVYLGREEDGKEEGEG
jgi:GTPase